MEIQQLRHFLAVVKHGSICSAADATNITQSGLSRSLKNLESSIGLPLFKRGPRGVHPTPFGTSLVARAKLIINERDRAMDELRAIRLAKAGSIKIGMTPNFSLYFASNVVTRYSAERPNLDFVVTTGPPSHLIEMLLEGELDFAIALLSPDNVLDEDLKAEILFESASVVLANRDHPLANRKNVSIPELAEHSWAIIDSPAFQMAFVKFFDDNSLSTPRQAMRTNSIAFLLNCIEQQRLLTVLPRVTNSNRLAENLVEIDAPAFGALAHASFIYRSDELLMTPAMKNVMHVFRLEASRIMQGLPQPRP